MIVTISGASGVGKTTIENLILKKLPDARIVVSITTREKRNNDNPDEYRYVSRLLFWLLEKIGAFLWTVDIHGNRYGTMKWSIRKALKNYKEVSFMIIVPDRLKNLWDYVLERGSENFIVSFYVISPPVPILKRRLQARGESEFEIAKRIKDCQSWDSQALASDVPYIFVRNDGKIEDTVEEILDYINEEVSIGQLF